MAGWGINIFGQNSFRLVLHCSIWFLQIFSMQSTRNLIYERYQLSDSLDSYYSSHKIVFFHIFISLMLIFGYILLKSTLLWYPPLNLPISIYLKPQPPAQKARTRAHTQNLSYLKFSNPLVVGVCTENILWSLTWHTFYPHLPLFTYNWHHLE